MLGVFWAMLRAAVQGLTPQEWSTNLLPSGRLAELCRAPDPPKVVVQPFFCLTFRCNQLCFVAFAW